jgi:septum formation protein
MSLINLLKEGRYNIILASQSPRRQNLLKELGIDFDIVIKEVDEKYPNNLKKEEIPMYLSELKASVFNNLGEKDILITSDTVVCVGDDVLGKPKDYYDAEKMLRKLSNNTHTVYTGVCIKSQNNKVVFYDRTDVYFREITDSEIDYYIRKYEPYDKAGAYGIQEWIGYTAIEKIDGSYFNVMGLPTHKVYDNLYKFLINR